MSDNLTERKTFFQLMEQITAAEDASIEEALTRDQLLEILGDLKGKVDGLHDWDQKLKFDELKVADDIRLLQARKSTIQNARKTLRKSVGEIMKMNDTSMVQGNVWQVKVSQRKSVKVLPIELTSDHYLNFKSVIKRDYSFDVTKLKSAYTANPEEFKDFVEVGTIDVVNFSAFNPVKKGEKDESDSK